ncbi:MAG TPA: TlpA disulfide reductase family protein [Dokdonella sp.]|uniref:TlpA disulfide reductase family protein n=1 Tax=Dokdonella sp. TaxID=2291710 RepID=UPI0025B9647C|nr:TlpA disulfide reductase family protein [Dokdonella sp.]MBX3690992.1 TlpA family protein disulfide reductase [Dokdonella sp.]HNR91263.1 TlpA disulfide reductase family protein [Dokdonella sp.]
MPDRNTLLIVALAIVGALGGLGLSLWLRPPSAPLPVATTTMQARTLAIGDLREDVALPDREGRTRHLSEWDGRLVLLNFWASWCGPCREEMPLLDQMQARHADKGLTVIGIAAEEAEPALAFLQSHPVDYQILIDAPAGTADVSLRFGNTRSVLPYNVLIGRDGRILASRVGNFDEAGLERWLAPHL